MVYPAPPSFWYSDWNSCSYSGVLRKTETFNASLRKLEVANRNTVKYTSTTAKCVVAWNRVFSELTVTWCGPKPRLYSLRLDLIPAISQQRINWHLQSQARWIVGCFTLLSYCVPLHCNRIFLNFVLTSDVFTPMTILSSSWSWHQAAYKKRTSVVEQHTYLYFQVTRIHGVANTDDNNNNLSCASPYTSKSSMLWAVSDLWPINAHSKGKAEFPTTVYECPSQF